MTLARFFIGLRSKAGLSLRAVGKKCKPELDAVTVWKIETGRPVRAATLAQILHAIGLDERDNAYLEAFAYWSTEQAGTLAHARVAPSMTRARKKNDREFDKLVTAATAALRQVPDRDRPVIVEALGHPAALVLWMQSRK
jgi:hypothetical protein